MTTFELSDGRQDETGGTRGQVRITRFMAHDLRIGRKGVSLGVSPGVLLIMPLLDNVKALIGSDMVTIMRGMSLLTAGDATISLIPEWRKEEQPCPEVSVRVVELDAVLNGVIALREHLDLPSLQDSETSTRLMRIYERLLLSGETLRLRGTATDVYGLFLMAELVITLLATSGNPANMPLPQEEETRMLRLKRFLMDNIGSKVSVPDMAAHMAMSEKTLTRWTLRRYDAPPVQYFKELRLQKSLELLSQSARTIEEVAEKTGFPDRFYFSKEFKKRFGSGPARLRKALNAVPSVDYFGEANGYFRRAQFKKALTACNRGIQLTTSAVVREQLSCLLGRCLRALGQTQEAMAVWSTLRHTTYAHEAGEEECRLLCALGQHDDALEKFRSLYVAGDESQKESMVLLWMDQVVSLLSGRQATLLRHFMALRGELFPQDLTSMRLAVDALRALEENEEALRQCGQIRSACFHALRRAGRLEEAIAHYGEPDNSLVYLQFGWYEDAEKELEKHPDPALRVRLLTALGRAEEAIREYPDHSAFAYFRLGRYKDLLDRFGDPSVERVYTQYALGLTEDLKKYSPESPEEWLNAQLCARPEVVLTSTWPDAPAHRGRARLILALRNLQRNEPAEAEALLAEHEGIRSPNLWWEDHSDTELFVLCVLRGMLLGRDLLRLDLDHAVQHFKFKMRQRLWHDAAYLAGVIDDAGYRSQPAREEIGLRLSFVQAIAHDIAGRQGNALIGYGPFAGEIAPQDPSGLIRQAFGRWRLQKTFVFQSSP